MEQGGGLCLPCLLDHLVEDALLVLQQHIGLIVLMDLARIQNLQSNPPNPAHSTREQGVGPTAMYLTSHKPALQLSGTNKHFSPFTDD